MSRRSIGWVLSLLPALFLAFDAVMKLVKPAFVVEATVRLGYPEGVIVGLGVILLTGYLGGAVATHVRVGSGLFSIILPVILGALLWGGLVVRDDRLRALLRPRA